MLGHTAFDQRVGGPIELPRGRPRNRLEQLVDRNAQALGQFVKRAGMRIRCAAREGAECALVELGGGYHLLECEIIASHDATKVRRHGRGVAILCADGNHAS